MRRCSAMSNSMTGIYKSYGSQNAQLSRVAFCQRIDRYCVCYSDCTFKLLVVSSLYCSTMRVHARLSPTGRGRSWQSLSHRVVCMCAEHPLNRKRLKPQLIIYELIYYRKIFCAKSPKYFDWLHSGVVMWWTVGLRGTGFRISFVRILIEI